MSENCCSGQGVILSFILGTLAGATAVLLLAPAARRESADRIRDFSSDIRERANDYLDQAKDKASSALNRSRDYLDDKRSLIQSAVDAGKDAYQREKGERGKPAPEGA